MLDVTASFEQIGKTPQKDLAAEKSTYPALLGLDGARDFFDETLEQAKSLLGQLEKESDFSAEEIQKIIAKKAKKYADEKKLVAYLARQGFSYDEIKRALSKDEF